MGKSLWIRNKKKICFFSILLSILVCCIMGAYWCTELFIKERCDYEEELSRYKNAYESALASRDSSRSQFLEKMVCREQGVLLENFRKQVEYHHLRIIRLEEKENMLQFVVQGDIRQYLLFWEHWNCQYPLVALDISQVEAKTSFVQIEGSFLSLFYRDGSLEKI